MERTTGEIETRDRVSVEAAETAVARLRDGAFVVLADSRLPGNRGTLMLAAEHATPDAVHHLATRTLGLIRLCLTDERCRELGLGSLAVDEADWQPSQSISAIGVDDPGASAADRARTIAIAADPAGRRDQLTAPGYVFPLRARPDGVLRRAGRTEAAVDLARLAGAWPAAAMSLVLNDDGSVASGADLDAFCELNDYPLVTISDVVAYRRRNEHRLVLRIADARLPTTAGTFAAIGFREVGSERCHLAMVMGSPASGDDVLVRVQRACLAGDVFGSSLCDCDRKLRRALDLVAAEGVGVVLYLTPADADRGLVGHDEPASFANGSSTAGVDELGIGAQILADLGLGRIRVLGTKPVQAPGIEGFGLEVVEYVPLTLDV